MEKSTNNGSLIGCCATCKYWEIDEYYAGKGINRGECTRANNENEEDLMTAVCEREGIYGELVTREDFGCILHSAC